MQKTALWAVLITLAGIGTAAAQELPDGTFSSTKDGCSKLQGKSPKELGEALDFFVLTKKGLVSGDMSCDFVNVYSHDAKSWVATAYCDEQGYSYPDVVSISQRPDGGMNVTRMGEAAGLSESDANSDSSSDTSQSGDQDSANDNADKSDDNTADNGADQNSGGDQSGNYDNMTAYTRCQ